jgi:hypothetical protein
MSMARTSANYIGPFSTNGLISMLGTDLAVGKDLAVHVVGTRTKFFVCQILPSMPFVNKNMRLMIFLTCNCKAWVYLNTLKTTFNFLFIVI